MTNREVALLAFKLLGLWLMVNALVSVASIPFFYWSPRIEEVSGVIIFTTVLPALVAIAIGVPVWFSAEWFAERIFPAALPDPLESRRLRAEPLFALALSVMGVLFVCEAVPALVSAAALFTQDWYRRQTVPGPNADQWQLLWDTAARANAVGTMSRLLIGLGLLAGPNRLAAAAARVKKELKGDLVDDGNRDVG